MTVAGTTTRGRLRLIAGPAAAVLVMLPVLLGLGVWQLERLSWKEGILARIDAAEAAPAVPLPANPGPFEKVWVSGRLRGDLRAFYGAEVRATPEGPTMGAQLIEPLARDNADPVLVVLGWVPTDGDPRVDGPARVEGFVRRPEKSGLLSASDDPVTRRFFTLDPRAIGASLGLPRVAPFVLEALGPPAPPGAPDPARALPRPPNNHLEYALTWFAFAVNLVVVFVVWSRKRLRP